MKFAIGLLISAFLILVVIAFLPVTHGYAQNPDVTPFQLTATAGVTHSSCTVASGQTRTCFVSDGWWQSINGAAYTPVATPASVAGVTSVNGQTGAVVLTIPKQAMIPATSAVSVPLQ